MDDTLFSQLTQLWLNLNPNQPWHLGSADLQITSILGTPQSTQPWANACPYQQLYEQASSTERTFKLTFATPTAFRQGKYDTPLPTPESVFKSLLNRWNKYSSLKITDFTIDNLFPSCFDIQTQIVTDSRSKFIGCVGKVEYRLLGEVDSLQIKHFNVLADYALYCGIGRKTTMGMGMTRRVVN
uniref:CRISPR-associated endoribonuclease Cas6 n=1 Tax=Cyanothece sp. BG0011 TaxID=2082950 RepID=UPI0030DC1000